MKKIESSSQEVVKEWMGGSEHHQGGRQGRKKSQWLRDERDVEWVANLGKDNYYQHYMANYVGERKERVVRDVIVGVQYME